MINMVKLSCKRRLEPVVTILLLMAPLFISLSVGPVAFADVELTGHGGTSNCLICHLAEDPDEPICSKCHYSIYGEEYNPFVHEVGHDIVYGTCAEGVHCHDVLAEALNASVHKSLNCGGCHVPLHVSLYDGGVGGWLFVNRLNSSRTISYKPILPVSLNRTIFYFDSTNDTTKLGSVISNWGGEVHWAWVNISGSASSISASTRYLTCFNCHFLTTNPAEAGLTRMIKGRTLIAIPEFTLKLSPHGLTDLSLREAASNTSQFVMFEKNEVSAASGIIAGFVIIGLFLWRKRT